MKKVILLLMILTMTLSFAGCGSANDQQNQSNPTHSPSTDDDSDPSSSTNSKSGISGFPITVTDSRGKQVTFEKKPEKIVTLMPSNTEILYEIDAEDNIIAVSDYCNYPEDTANKQKLPTGEQMDIEVLIGLNPDVVILGSMTAMNDQIDRMEESNIKVVVTEANNLQQTYEVINLLGKITGNSKQASKLIEDMKHGFQAIKEEVKGKLPVSIYVEVSPLEYGLWSCGKNTFIQELIEIVGSENIFDDIEGWAAVAEEQVIIRNPDIILTTSSPLTGIDDPAGEIASRSNWSNINAVKNQKVLMLDSDMSSRPGPRLLDCAKELVRAIYES